MSDILIPELDGWRSALQHIQKASTYDGFVHFLMTTLPDSALDKRALEILTTLYGPSIIFRSLFLTNLLACIQEPSDRVPAALHEIAKATRAITFRSNAPRGDQTYYELYRDQARVNLPRLPLAAELHEALGLAYLAQTDMPGDQEACNRALALARDASLQRKRDQALRGIAQASVFSIMGNSIWVGWTDEGSNEFGEWLLLLTTSANSCRLLDLIPFKPLEHERVDQEARCKQLSAIIKSETPQKDPSELETADLSDDMMAILESIAERSTPLSDDEAKNFGVGALKAIGESARELIHAYRQALADDDVDDEQIDSYVAVAVLAIRVLGNIQANEPDVVELLLSMMTDDGDDSEVGEAAFSALALFGDPAINQARAYERYSLDPHTRMLAMTVIGAAGNGRPEIFDELRAGYQQTTWSGDRGLYIAPLANTRDARVVPLFIEALGDPALRHDDAVDVLMCLEDFEVPFTVDPDSGTITFQEHGTFPDRMPGGWPPDDVDDFDVDFDDAHDDEGPIIIANAAAGSQGSVVYDKQGVPRDPITGDEMHFVKGAWRPAPRLAAPSTTPEIGRNAPCPCGSGKKYKYCHGKDAV